MIQSRQVGDDFHMIAISPTLSSAALRESTTSIPTSEEEVQFRTLEQWCREHLQDPGAINEPLHVLADSCIRWKDFNRWDNLMGVCNIQSNPRLLSSTAFVKACQEFGFALMKPL
jgi:hypothetical protein